MAVHVIFLLLAFVRAGIAMNASAICANCNYNNGVGYVGSDDNCHVFFQCEKQVHGSVKATLMCCPPGTVWLPSHLVCNFGKCDDSYDPCPQQGTTTEYPCPFEPVEGSKNQYKISLTHEVADCPDATVYSEEDCACVHGGEKTCSDDPLMYFPFAKHFNDIQCQKVAGTKNGDAELVEDGGYVRLDGDGDYVSFGFGANYFAWNPLSDFTISLWFSQTQDGLDNINNSPVEGLYGNGDCEDDASIWITLGDETVQGGIRTDDASIWITLGDETVQGGIRTDDVSGVFNNTEADVPNRFYNQPDTWYQVAIRYTKTEVSLFLNGQLVGTRAVSGFTANTFAARTIGLVTLNCSPFFFTGCVDDVLIFTRYVSNEEIDQNVYQRGRTEAGEEDPYVSDFFP